MATLKFVLALVVLQVWLAPTIAHVGRKPAVINAAKTVASADVENETDKAKITVEDDVYTVGRKSVASSKSDANASLDGDGAHLAGDTDSSGTKGRIVFEKTKTTTNVNGHENTEAVDTLTVGRKTITFKEPQDGTRAGKLEDKLEDTLESGGSARDVKKLTKKLMKVEKQEERKEKRRGKRKHRAAV